MKGNALKAASIYKQYTGNNNASILIIETSGLISYVNDTFCRLSGYAKKELLGQKENMLFSNDQTKLYLESIEDALNRGNIWHDKLKNKKKDNSYYWVDRTIIPFLDTNGQVEMFVSIYVDITDQKVLSDTILDTYAVDQNSIIAKTNNEGIITYVNDNFCDITGYSKSELIGKNHNLLNSGNQSKAYWKKMYQTISKGNIWQDEVKNRTKNGKYYWVDTTIVPHMDSDGKPESYISIRTDITEQKELSHTLIKHKFAIDQHAIIATTDVKGNITYVNDKFCEVSGYSKDELTGRNHKILNSGNQPTSYWKRMYDSVSNGDIWKDQVKNISKNGSYYWVDTTIIPFMDDKNRINSYFSIRTDITYQKRIEEILSSQRFAMDQHSIIAITDVKGSITYVNDKFCHISGYSEDELIGQNHRLLNSGDQSSSYWKEMYQTLKKDGVWQDEIKNKTKNGKYYWVDTTIVPLLDSIGKADCYIAIRTDITKYKKVQEELKEHKNNLEKLVEQRTLELNEANKNLKNLSEIDTLTKLYNRRKLNTDFNKEIKKVTRFNRKMALYFLDLDGFKGVNDKFGHEIGDKLLQCVANNVLTLLREHEYLYRIGGDEFCILVPEFHEREDLEVLAKRVLETISNITLIDRFKIDIGCSIGISIFPDNGESLTSLISEADKAMYLIKQQGKNNYHLIF